MVQQQIESRAGFSQRLLDAMTAVPRHLFVSLDTIDAAYEDRPLPIAAGQTISQPYMVAVMTEALSLDGSERVLEVGTGCGYQTAVLSQMAREILSIERQSELVETTTQRLADLGYSNVQIFRGDGSLGYPDRAPYRAIIVTAASPLVPRTLLDQLAEGGRLVIPVGKLGYQNLLRITKQDGCLRRESLMACQFVPLLGQYGWPDNLQEFNRA
jgi:protein-L-isoaspartate(D-aspartate) O-methyltransferase